jgi:hypothetical protein
LTLLPLAARHLQVPGQEYGRGGSRNSSFWDGRGKEGVFAHGTSSREGAVLKSAVTEKSSTSISFAISRGSLRRRKRLIAVLANFACSSCNFSLFSTSSSPRSHARLSPTTFTEPMPLCVPSTYSHRLCASRKPAFALLPSLVKIPPSHLADVNSARARKQRALLEPFSRPGRAAWLNARRLPSTFLAASSNWRTWSH